jgi:hypothetical protein
MEIFFPQIKTGLLADARNCQQEISHLTLNCNIARELSSMLDEKKINDPRKYKLTVHIDRKNG